MKGNIKRTKFNISLLGDSLVGKTLIIQSHLKKTITGNYLTTLGIENYLDSAIFDGTEYSFKIYDTAGQERFRSLSKSVIKITDGFLLVFSVLDKKSFEHINFWYESIEKEINLSKKVIILVGNKVDLPNRTVSNNEATNYANFNNLKYYETSALNGYNINELFDTLYQDIYNLNKSSLRSQSIMELKNNKKKKNSGCC